MILFNLACGQDHQFEAWFKNGESYDQQAERHSIACPVCGDHGVRKAPMAPSLARGASPPQEQLVALRRAVEAHFEDVGADFAEQARQIHYGETELRPIRGRATLPETRDLIEEGIAVLPMPWPIDHDA